MEGKFCGFTRGHVASIYTQLQFAESSWSLRVHDSWGADVLYSLHIATAMKTGVYHDDVLQFVSGHT